MDRAALHEYLPARPPSRIAWAREGIDPLPRTLQRSQLPWTIGQIERADGVRFSRLDELPAAAAIDRQSYEAAGTRSCLVRPLRNGGPILGALFLESVRGERAWPDGAVLERLGLLGEVFAGVLERKRVELSLDEQLRFEVLLSEQSAAFSRVSAADVDREIEQALRRTVDFLGVDRGSLAEFSPDGGWRRASPTAGPTRGRSRRPRRSTWRRCPGWRAGSAPARSSASRGSPTSRSGRPQWIGAPTRDWASPRTSRSR